MLSDCLLARPDDAAHQAECLVTMAEGTAEFALVVVGATFIALFITWAMLSLWGRSAGYN